MKHSVLSTKPTMTIPTARGDLSVALKSSTDKSPLTRRQERIEDCRRHSILGQRTDADVHYVNRCHCESWGCPWCAKRLAKQWRKRLKGLRADRVTILYLPPGHDASRSFSRFCQWIRRHSGRLGYVKHIRLLRSQGYRVTLASQGPLPHILKVAWEREGGKVIKDQAATGEAALNLFMAALEQAGSDLPLHFRSISSSFHFVAPVYGWTDPNIVYAFSPHSVEALEAMDQSAGYNVQFQGGGGRDRYIATRVATIW